MVAGFSRSAPNTSLINYALRVRSQTPRLRILDIGCGAGRNAVPLSELGAEVVGTDLSWPMASAARRRVAVGRLNIVLAPMDALPVKTASFDLVVAHGIWNLSRSDRELREAIREAGRAAAPGSSLFVFTFSRNTLPAGATPIHGETMVFTQFSGTPQVFLTSEQLVTELAAAGFTADAALPLRELNLPAPGQPRCGAPVIYEAGFRYSGR